MCKNNFRTMKKILYIFAFTAAMASCDKGGKFCVEGSIEDATDTMLYLEEATLEGVRAVDSVRLGADGSFCFKAIAPQGCPGFYMLRIGDERINISIDSTETVSITAKLPEFSKNYEVTGSDDCQKIKEICMMQRQVQSHIIALEKNENMYPGDIADSIAAIITRYKEDIKARYIFPQPSKAHAYYAVCQSLTDLRGSFMLFNPVNDREDVKAYAAVATAWDCFYPEAPRTVQLCNAAIKGLDNTAPVKQKAIEVDESKISETGIIDIDLPDINSNIRSLASLKGKVVVLDFTAFNAPESAKRTRLLRSLYEKYSSQGLEIYQVSVDEDIHYWKTSVEHLPWISVHETDGRAISSYGVSTLPTFFLINRDNEIVVRSDFMEGTLESNIQKLL